VGKRVEHVLDCIDDGLEGVDLPGRTWCLEGAERRGDLLSVRVYAQS
jgi:hypothetical protein